MISWEDEEKLRKIMREEMIDIFNKFFTGQAIITSTPYGESELKKLFDQAPHDLKPFVKEIVDPYKDDPERVKEMAEHMENEELIRKIQEGPRVEPFLKGPIEPDRFQPIPLSTVKRKNLTGKVFQILKEHEDLRRHTDNAVTPMKIGNILKNFLPAERTAVMDALEQLVKEGSIYQSISDGYNLVG